MSEFWFAMICAVTFIAIMFSLELAFKWAYTKAARNYWDYLERKSKSDLIWIFAYILTSAPVGLCVVLFYAWAIKGQTYWR